MLRPSGIELMLISLLKNAADSDADAFGSYATAKAARAPRKHIIVVIDNLISDHLHKP